MIFKNFQISEKYGGEILNVNEKVPNIDITPNILAPGVENSPNKIYGKEEIMRHEAAIREKLMAASMSTCKKKFRRVLFQIRQSIYIPSQRAHFFNFQYSYLHTYILENVSTHR